MRNAGIIGCLTGLLAFGMQVAAAQVRAITFTRLDGRVQKSSNTVGKDGRVHKFVSPQLRIYRTTAKQPDGTVFLLPGGGFEQLEMEEAEALASEISLSGFNAVILDYSINDKTPLHHQAIRDGLKGFDWVKNQPMSTAPGSRMVIMGVGTGGYLAAEITRRLGADQPASLVLMNPKQMDEKIPGMSCRPPGHHFSRKAGCCC